MAKGKRSSGTSTTSKGERRSCAKNPRASQADRMMNKMRALEKGKDVVFTIENPNKAEGQPKFIKQRVSGKAHLAKKAGK